MSTRRGAKQRNGYFYRAEKKRPELFTDPPFERISVSVLFRIISPSKKGLAGDATGIP
jgi:hypothetical protein